MDIANRDAFVLTVSGTCVHFMDPLPGEIIIEDIAHSLARTIRWGGHTHYSMTVAQHSVMVSELVKYHGGNERVQLHALLHDASEAYLSDLPRPVKEFCRDYQEIEDKLQGHIYTRFGIDDHHLYAAMTHRADIDCGRWESRDLMGNTPFIAKPEVMHPKLTVLKTIPAEEAFLDLFDHLIAVGAHTS